VFQAFEAEPNRDWAGEYKRSSVCAQYVTGEMAAVAPAARPRQAAPAPRTRNHLSQLSTLTRRYLAVIASDRVYLGFLAGAPIALAAIVRAVGGGLTATTPASNTSASALLLILAIGACFTGALNAVREIVKERSIYARERAAGLSSGAYMWSKLLVLGVLSAAQAALMTVIGLAGRAEPPHGVFIKGPALIELAVAMGLLAITSMTLGLLISSAVSTSEKSLPLLFISVMAQVVFTGGVIQIAGQVGLEQLAWISPSRWGFAAVASTTNLSVISPPLKPGAKPDPLWQHTPHTWLLDMGMMIVLAAVFSFITWRRLEREGPGRRR
jgi:hypothetical protein